ncbi:MAG: SWIM zinc finger family protein [Cyanobacteria bacterium J06632_3]
MWTSEQVLALSPNAVAVKRGKALAITSKWALLGASAQVVWGECYGSGKTPYRTIIDLSEPAFRCSCPSRQVPCKHALGLFLLWTEQATFSQGEPPEWVVKWLELRSRQRVSTSSERPLSEKTLPEGSAAANNPDAQAAQAAQAQKRFEKRTANVEAGLVDLEQWLLDLICRGLADLPNEPYRFWDQAAARLVDAQAPGLARRVRALAGIPHSGSGWPERMLKALGQLYVLVQSYRQLDTLDPMMRSQILTQIGFTQKQEDLLQRSRQSDSQSDSDVSMLEDTWQVLGKFVTEEDALKTQRVWLWGRQHQKAALVLSFAHGRRQVLDNSLVPGMSFRGQLVFYPGTGVQRAFVVSRQEATEEDWGTLGTERIEESIAQYAHALLANPWQVDYPLILRQIFLRYDASCWWLQDAQGHVLPIAKDFSQGWTLLAMSGGRPLSLFGEWNGTSLLPLSVWSEKKFMALHNSEVR